MLNGEELRELKSGDTGRKDAIELESRSSSSDKENINALKEDTHIELRDSNANWEDIIERL